jgi:integrase
MLPSGRYQARVAGWARTFDTEADANRELAKRLILIERKALAADTAHVAENSLAALAGENLLTGDFFGGRMKRGVAALTKWLHALPTYCPSNPHGLLVPRPGGTPADKNYAPRSWEIPHGNKNVRARAIEKLGPMGAYPLLRAAGIDRHMRLHDLRHTGATAALNGHLDGERYSLTEVGTMLGHKDVRTTQIYAQSSEGDLFAEVARRRARAEEVGIAKWIA